MTEIKLPEKANAAAAAPFYDTLRGSLGSPVTVDASEVKTLGAQILQVILTARAKWDADGHGFVVANPTEEFLSTAQMMGFTARDVGVSEAEDDN